MPAPTGFKRSRALWDNARRESPPGSHPAEKLMRVLRAVLYEFQPIRFDELDTQTWIHRVQAVWKSLVWFAVTIVPSWSRIVFEFLKSMTAKQWMWVGAILCYYGAVRWIHYVLDAGPVVIIVTALVAIFTIGLGDDENSGNTLSAYSAFNRGFQQIMGSVDGEALMNQYVGGAMAMPMGGFGRQEEEEEEAPFRNDRRREQQQQRRGREQEQPPADEDDDDYDDSDEDDDDDDAPALVQPRARLTGKKARRKKSLEQRREMKRQRDAAIAMGFGGDQNGEFVAMNRLVEDQVMAAGEEAGDG
jgi:hypothetical protein